MGSLSADVSILQIASQLRFTGIITFVFGDGSEATLRPSGMVVFDTGAQVSVLKANDLTILFDTSMGPPSASAIASRGPTLNIVGATGRTRVDQYLFARSMGIDGILIPQPNIIFLPCGPDESPSLLLGTPVMAVTAMCLDFGSGTVSAMEHDTLVNLPVVFPPRPIASAHLDTLNALDDNLSEIPTLYINIIDAHAADVFAAVLSCPAPIASAAALNALRAAVASHAPVAEVLGWWGELESISPMFTRRRSRSTWPAGSITTSVSALWRRKAPPPRRRCPPPLR